MWGDLRTGPHYEAMEVDTPPRPSSTSFPPSATATTNPFGFDHSSSSAPPPPGVPHPLSFDANAFQPEKAFGLEEEVEMNEVSMSAEGPEELIPQSSSEEGGKENLSLIPSNGTRRRKTSSSRRKASSSSRPTIHTDDSDSDDGDHHHNGDDEGFLSVLKSKVGGRRGGGEGQFSFQVHHHHAPGSGALMATNGGVGVDGQGGPGGEKWLKSGTPYVLLGCVRLSSPFLFPLPPPPKLGVLTKTSTPSHKQLPPILLARPPLPPLPLPPPPLPLHPLHRHHHPSRLAHRLPPRRNPPMRKSVR